MCQYKETENTFQMCVKYSEVVMESGTGGSCRNCPLKNLPNYWACPQTRRWDVLLCLCLRYFEGIISGQCHIIFEILCNMIMFIIRTGQYPYCNRHLEARKVPTNFRIVFQMQIYPSTLKLIGSSLYHLLQTTALLQLQM